MAWEVLNDLKAKLMLNRGNGEISQPGDNIVHGTTKCKELRGTDVTEIATAALIVLLELKDCFSMGCYSNGYNFYTAPDLL
ncbi:hypothetical protein WN944_027448 [Citrus x changshan-huyou]|uniref:Uncharacterized protein n=1 Tax=Citrus x changshan-huyou TaxID=2935761 RepID=A0AAP0LI01_9ROSI